MDKGRGSGRRLGGYPAIPTMDSGIWGVSKDLAGVLAHPGEGPEGERSHTVP
jgi:hypothetical protein